MNRLLTKRERFIAYLITAAVCFAIAYNIVIKPLIEKNRRLNKKIGASEIKLKKYRRLLRAKDYLREDYGKYLLSDNSATDIEDTFLGALSELEKLAKTCNIQILDIRPDQKRKVKGAFSESKIELKTEGRLEDYLKFIYNMENTPSLLKINKLQLKSKTNTDLLEGRFTIGQIIISD